MHSNLQVKLKNSLICFRNLHLNGFMERQRLVGIIYSGKLHNTFDSDFDFNFDNAINLIYYNLQHQ